MADAICEKCGAVLTGDYEYRPGARGSGMRTRHIPPCPKPSDSGGAS